MNLDLIPFLRCTSGCQSELKPEIITRGNIDEIFTGWLECPDCGRKFTIQEGILRMLPANLCSEPTPDASTCGATAKKRSEMQARDAQVGDYDRMWYLNLFGKVEIPLTLRHLEVESHHTLLEAGCGTGRMTPVFASKCDHLVSADFSWESLRSCSAKLQKQGIKNVDLIQADICDLPLRTDSFERVVSCQVLEHVPTSEHRGKAVGELARVMKTGGKLVLSAYQHSLLTRLFGKKEGEHDGGIYFYRFAREELRSLLSQSLKVEAVTGAMVYHFIARCRK